MWWCGCSWSHGVGCLRCAASAASAAYRCRRSPLPPLHPPLAGNVLMGAAFYSLIFMLIGVRKSASETMQLN
jgi:hypothetical protein